MTELWFNTRMLKTQAIELLGGSAAATAKAIGISYQAVRKWPDELPPRIADRVYAVWGKKNMPDSPPAMVNTAQAATENVAQGDATYMRDMLTAQRDRAAQKVAANPDDCLQRMILENRNDALQELTTALAETTQAATENVAQGMANV